LDVNHFLLAISFYIQAKSGFYLVIFKEALAGCWKSTTFLLAISFYNLIHMAVPLDKKMEETNIQNGPI
jgi:hypothetical protein